MTRTGQQPRTGDQGMISVDEPGATVAECDDQRSGLNAFDGRSPSDRGQGVFQQFVYEDQRQVHLTAPDRIQLLWLGLRGK